MDSKASRDLERQERANAEMLSVLRFRQSQIEDALRDCARTVDDVVRTTDRIIESFAHDPRNREDLGGI